MCLSTTQRPNANVDKWPEPFICKPPSQNYKERTNGGTNLTTLTSAHWSHACAHAHRHTRNHTTHTHTHGGVHEGSVKERTKMRRKLEENGPRVATPSCRLHSRLSGRVRGSEHQPGRRTRSVSESLAWISARSSAGLPEQLLTSKTQSPTLSSTSA